LINYYIFVQFLNAILHVYFQSGTSLVPTNDSKIVSRTQTENKSFTYLAVGTVIGAGLGLALGPRIRPYFSDSIRVGGKVLRGPKAMPENTYHRTIIEGMHAATGMGVALTPTNIAYNMFEKDISFIEAVEDVFATTLVSDARDRVRDSMKKYE
jgi:hypothetical protein